MAQPPIPNPSAPLAAPVAFQAEISACKAHTALDCKPRDILEAVAEG
jgi:hypothetical protein